ncbi:MAG: RNA 2',3'-cyclic phosphodiesterase [Planctomycetota bacterium]|nr:MAG: RNA 2',3'-cyclic phosphodiesterase [Planctomycetota bacterium]
MPKTRTFIAVEAADEVHAAALAAIDRLRSAATGIKWVEPDNLHWTLQFLGDLTDMEVAEVCLRTVRVAAEHEAFAVQARGVGAFPSIKRPRTLWLGAGEGAERLIALQADVEQALSSLGFRGENRQFVPHLTLGRAGRNADGGALLAQRLAKLADFDGGAMAVDAVTVFASELGRDGPTYHVLARAPLS